MAREKWTGRTSFILAAIGSAVGLGNAWRFPGLVSKHGGGAFLLVYVIAMLVVGVPLLMTEVAIGRKTRLGAPGSMRAIMSDSWLCAVSVLMVRSVFPVLRVSVRMPNTRALTTISPTPMPMMTRFLPIVSSCH